MTKLSISPLQYRHSEDSSPRCLCLFTQHCLFNSACHSAVLLSYVILQSKGASNTAGLESGVMFLHVGQAVLRKQWNNMTTIIYCPCYIADDLVPRSKGKHRFVSAIREHIWLCLFFELAINC